MRRRAALLAIPAFASSFLVAACARGEAANGDIVVHVITPTTTPDAAASATVPGGGTTPIPAPELLLSTTRVYQAGTILASITGSVTGGSVSFLGRTYALVRGSQSMYSFVAVASEDPAGAARLTAEVILTNGSKGVLSADVDVLETAWTADSLVFTPEQTARYLDNAAAAKEEASLAAVYATRTAMKLWSGAWRLPVEGPLTARFGEERSINGAPSAGHHGGTDIGAEQGTPVGATNAGRVVMARQMELRGNMVVVDHGGGVLSGYAHLSAFAVAEGQDVATGDLLGYAGSSGLSTAAHLHWEIAVSGVLVDALRFTDGSNGF